MSFMGLRKIISRIVVIAMALPFSSCVGDNSLENRISELEKNAFIPGFGEFMNTIQLHHSKIWFAANAGNWDLARYELDEMKETFSDLSHYVTDRPEVQNIPMIQPALDSIENSVTSKSQKQFKSAYMLLTNTCNNCHRATKHDFNIITIPSQPPVTDQQFKLKEAR